MFVKGGQVVEASFKMKITDRTGLYIDIMILRLDIVLDFVISVYMT